MTELKERATMPRAPDVDMPDVIPDTPDNAPDTVPVKRPTHIGSAIADKQAFAEANLGLVHSIAARFKGRGTEYEELFSAGCLGLMKAVHAFDETRGVMFSTYAVPVIMGEIKRLFRDGGSVKVTRSLKELSVKAGRVREELRRVGRDPTISEIAAELGVTAENISEAFDAALPAISISARNTDNEDGHGSDTDIPVAPPEERITEHIALNQILSRLSADDRKLLYLRYTLDKTQTEAGDIMGQSQVQISRREKKLLGYIKGEMG
ncbi:MAG: sigma-70 family RNA polymerase sigma factor [Oscillospiraceae bacterium]|jgi:RNA polymerase sporulation-specific sigma factor|nr:sigma-70 family RNA polymerase sigma factor [Oscillospiraceae bacterium]